MKEQVEGVKMSDILKNWISNIRNWFFDLDVVVGFMDIVNFHRFKKEFNEEEKDPESIYNSFKLKRNTFKNIIYCQVNFTETDLMHSDYDANIMYSRRLKKISDYLGTTMGWNEYLDVDVSNFMDEDNYPTMSYVFIFRFIPKIFNFKSFFKWIGIILGCGVGIFLLVEYFMILIQI